MIMKNNLIKFLSLLFIIVMTFTVGGCGKTETDTGRVVKWEFLKAGYGMAPYEALAKAFMTEHPEITVKLIPNADIASTTPARLESANNLSDLYTVKIDDTAVLRTWAAKSWIDPIDDVYNYQLKSGKTIKESLINNAAEICTFDGKPYAVPEYVSISGFVYNKTLFDQYGWEIPKTTSELKKLCERILSDTDNKVAPIVYCGAAAEGYLYFGVENWTYQYEGIDNLNQFYSYETPEVFNPTACKGKQFALQNLQKFLFDEGNFTLKGSSGINHITAQSYLIQGKCAMMLNGSWFENEMSSVLKEHNSEIAMFAVPETSDSSGNVIRSETYSTVDDKRVLAAKFDSYHIIPTNASNKEDAKLFLEFLSEQSSCELFTQKTNTVRPFDYELSSSADIYKNMSSFGKSILDMAKENYLYIPNVTNPVALKNGLGFWANGSQRPYYSLRDGSVTVKKALEDDYEYATYNWSRFEKQAQ